MLISFKVSNSRSIGKELEFSAIATDDTILPENTIDLPKYGIRILKTMALFGANASGKTNILKAFADARNIICRRDTEDEQDIDKKDIFFPFNRNYSENKNISIAYSFTFLIDKIVYNYTFIHNQERILDELLTENIDVENEKIIYNRKFNLETKKYEWLPKSFFDNEDLSFFRRLTSENKLFLTLANRRVNEEVRKEPLLEQIYYWFKNQLQTIINIRNEGKLSRVLSSSKYKVISEEENNFDYFITFIQKSENNKRQVINFLKEIDIPIEEIQIIELAEPKSTDTIRPYLYVNLTKNENKASFVIVKTYHKAINEKGKKYLEDFDLFKEESSGTKVFLAWLGYWLYSFQKENQPNIFIIDELGTSLHPKLTIYLVKLFANSNFNKNNSQLIFTTHEVKLMDKTVLRPDQLYLVNRDDKGDTSVKRVSKFKGLDKYTRLDTLYMEGAMRGIPLINL